MRRTRGRTLETPDTRADDAEPFSAASENPVAEAQRRPSGREPEPSPLEGGGAILVVETEPDGVEVLVGDSLAGVTPLQVRGVRAGAYPITLRHPHYETVRLDGQELSDGRVLRIERALTRAAGAITIITDPAGAWVERGGERLAQGTPVTLEGLPAGLVELTLGAEEHRSVRVEAEVPKGGVGLLERVLERIPHGTLTLELDPSDAEVTLPGLGSPYRSGMRVAEGSHRVVAARAGYREAVRDVVVSGDTVERIKLERVAGSVFSDALSSGGEGPEMVVVPAGTFRMGCLSNDDDCEGDELPVHEVAIRSFALSKHEVMFAQWDACVAAGGCGGYRPDDEGWGRGDRPVINVSWDDAQSFVAWLSEVTGHAYRLPTESEWEYAARAGRRDQVQLGERHR